MYMYLYTKFHAYLFVKYFWLQSKAPWTARTISTKKLDEINSQLDQLYYYKLSNNQWKQILEKIQKEKFL